MNADKLKPASELPEYTAEESESEWSTEAVGEQKQSEWRQGKYLGIISVLLYFLIWFLITEDGLELVRPIKFPSPRMVVEAAITISSVLAKDILVTVARVIIGWGAGVALGVGLGLWMSFNKKVYYFFDPVIESIRPVPVIAMIPFFLLWFGINETGKFLLVMMGVFAIIVVSTVESVRNVPKIYIRAAETLGASSRQIFRRIIIPAIIPQLIGPLRVSAALSFTLVVAGEFMGAQAGLGYRILEARRLFNTDVILLGIVLFGILSGISDNLLRRITNYITRWSERQV
jgi:ABC-type nitrate/sulfonate/bicarbonate transport system permease component